MDVNLHTTERETEVQLREFNATDAIRQPFITLDFHQSNDRLSIFIKKDPAGRLIASKVIELLQEAFFTPAPAQTSSALLRGEVL